MTWLRPFFVFRSTTIVIVVIVTIVLLAAVVGAVVIVLKMNAASGSGAHGGPAGFENPMYGSPDISGSPQANASGYMDVSAGQPGMYAEPGTRASTSFWTISPGFPSPAPLLPRRAACSTWWPCVWNADLVRAIRCHGRFPPSGTPNVNVGASGYMDVSANANDFEEDV